jgi:hypothetical protein
MEVTPWENPAATPGVSSGPQPAPTVVMGVAP